MYISQNKGNKDYANVSPWKQEPWKNFQLPIQPVEADVDAEEADAQSLNCEGQHDNQEEIERNAKAAFQKVLRFFQSQATVSNESLTDLIESTYGF